MLAACATSRSPGTGCRRSGWAAGSSARATGATGRVRRDQAAELVRRALDLGVNLIDTAEIYARGVSEAIVGQALGDRRSEAFVATKVLPVWPTAGPHLEHGRLSRLRLGIDAIDLYQIHSPNPAVPVPSNMEGMRRLLDAGVIRQVGVSNFSPAGGGRRGRPRRSGAVQPGAVQPAVPQARGPQPPPRPGQRPPNDRLQPARQRHARRPLRRHQLPNGSARRNNPRFLPENLERATPLIEALRRISATHDATPAQVALAWLLRRPNVVVIPGASSVEQLEPNIAAADLELAAEEDRELTDASDRYEPLGPTATARGLVAGRLRR